MKTVKFRIWNGHSMEYNVMAVFLGAFFVLGIDPKDTSQMSYFNTKYPEETPLMQSSGVPAKDGREVYEGDIFKIGAEDMLLEVKFGHGCFMAYYKGKQYGLIGELQQCFIDIVGNIYENPELLG